MGRIPIDSRVALPPAPGIPSEEIASRLKRVREHMEKAGVSALLLSAQNNVEYFSGYRTLSWTSNTRPIFLVINLNCAVLIGSSTEERNLATQQRPFDVRLYRGFIADALPIIVDSLRGESQRPVVAVDYGADMFGRGSIALLDTIRAVLNGASVIEAAPLLWAVRAIKTRLEADMMRVSFRIANDAFDDAVAQSRIGMSEIDLYRAIQTRIIARGADRADPFPVVFGRQDFAYNRPPSDQQLTLGDYVWSDFRSTYGGYPADRNRIAKAGPLGSAEQMAYANVRSLTLKLCERIRPGMTGGDAYSLFEGLWHGANLGPIYARASRIGHGGGMDLTEPPSIMAGSEEVIEIGMVLHIEPKLEVYGGVFQCEEVIWIGEHQNDLLTPPCPSNVPVIQ